VPQRPGERAEFSPNHVWMALTERIDQNGDGSDRDYHLHFARRVNDSVYKYERKLDAELENKVLSLVLRLYGYQRSDCQRYSIVPGGHWTADSQSIAVVKRRKRSGAGKEIANQRRSKLRAPSMSPSITSGW
jgi:hypothetical protein